MIARLILELPFNIVIPVKEKIHKSIEYKDTNYLVKIHPPSNDNLEKKLSKFVRLEINKNEAGYTNLLTVDFIKDNFNRTHGPTRDPSIEFMNKTINGFLSKFRTVSKQAGVVPVVGISNNWSLIYLNDDEAELEKKEGMHRTIWGRNPGKFFVVLNKDIWKDIDKLNPAFELPIWETLLFEAETLLPQIGPSIVLTFTSLQVFITDILNKLAESKQMPNNLWSWINNRRFKNPVVKEQYDGLLNIMLGKSLKDNKNLWKALDDLRDARNSFVHQGVVTIRGKAIGIRKARNFINKAHEIIKFIESALPNKMQWSEEYKSNFKLEFCFDEDNITK